MSTIDWPTAWPFRAASFSLGVDAPMSGVRGFYTGNRQTISHLADRMRGSLVLNPCTYEDAGAREAFILGLQSTGDKLRMAMPHRPVPNGTLRGSPVVAANALAGARSLPVTGALAGRNQLIYTSFELDTNADGLADGWALYTFGTTGGLQLAIPAGPLIAGQPGQFYQAVRDLALGGNVGIKRGAVPVSPSSAYTLSADLTATPGATVGLYIEWLDAANATITTVFNTHDRDLARRALSVTSPPLAVTAAITIYASATGGLDTVLNIDNVQFEAGSAPTPYAGFASLQGGDVLSVGGNLVHCAYSGVAFGDGGAASVPLTLPLQRPVAAGTPIVWDHPTGLWELDDDNGLTLDYSAGRIQQGIAIPLRQYIL